MPVEFKGHASSTGATVTLPAHAAGDIIVVFAYRLASNTSGALTPPSLPTAGGTVPTFVSVSANSGSSGTSSSNSLRIAYAVATSASHTSGTWTNASTVTVAVLSGQSSSPIGANSEVAASAGSTHSYPALTLEDASGDSAVLYFGSNWTSQTAARSFNALPSGYTARYTSTINVSDTSLRRLSTKNVTTSAPAFTNTTTSDFQVGRSASLEIKAAKNVTGDASFGSAASTSAVASVGVSADSGFGVNVSLTADSTRAGAADTGLVVSAGLSAGATVNRPVSASLAVSASRSAGAVENAAAVSSLAVTATRSAAIANPPSLGTLVERFNSANTSVWYFGPQTSVSNGVLNQPCVAQADGAQVYVHAQPSDGYKLEEGDSFTFQLKQAPNPGNGTTICALQVSPIISGSTLGSIQAYTWGTSTTWRFRQRSDAGVWSSGFDVAYSANTSWVQIAVTGGNIVWSTSPDGMTWTQRHSEVKTSTLKYVRMSLQCYYFGTETNPGTAIWDNFNVVPVQAQASLAVAASPSSLGTEFGVGGGSLSVFATPTATAGRNALVSASLAGTATTSTDGFDVTNVAGSLAVTATPSGVLRYDASASAGYSGVGNLVHNYGFEPDTAFVGSGDTSRSSLYARSGGHSAKITSTGSYPKVYVTPFPPNRIVATSGERFYVESWVRADPANVGSTGSVHVGSIAFASDNSIITYPGINLSASAVNSTGWTRISGVVVVPANTATIEFFVQVNADVPVGNSFYFDDVIVARLAPFQFTTTGTVGRNALALTALNATATPTPIARYDARAQAQQFIDTTQPGAILKTLNASTNLGATATPSTTGTEFGVANTSLPVTAAPSAVMSRRQGIAASLEATASPSTVGSRGQTVATATAATATFNAEAFANRAAQANLMFYGFPTGAGRRGHNTTAAFTITATSSGSGFEGGIAAASLTVTATRTAVASRRQFIGTSLAVTATPSGGMQAIARASASLAVTHNAWGTVDEPRELIDVPFDDRTAYVEDGDRTAHVGADTRTVDLRPDVRVAQPDAGGRNIPVPRSGRTATVNSESRTVEVPETDQIALVTK